MSKRRAVIIAGGELDLDPRSFITETDYLVCADSGADQMGKYDIFPDVVCGDMDSIDQSYLRTLEEMHVKILRFPVQKDLTDLEIAMQYILEEGYREVLCLGLDGKRMDHQMTNYLMLSRYAQQILLQIRAKNHRAYFLNQTYSSLTLTNLQGHHVSLVPLSQTTGISYQGLMYPLDNATLHLGSSRGMSNLVEDPEAQVSIKTGNALFFINYFSDRRA